jgi:hypothetical protein
MKRLNSKNNLIILFFLAVVIALGINFPHYTIPAISLLYLISPLFFFIAEKLKKKKPAAVIETEPKTEEAGEDRI